MRYGGIHKDLVLGRPLAEAVRLEAKRREIPQTELIRLAIAEAVGNPNLAELPRGRPPMNRERPSFGGQTMSVGIEPEVKLPSLQLVETDGEPLETYWHVLQIGL
jgi:hypothetical protein